MRIFPKRRNQESTNSITNKDLGLIIEYADVMELVDVPDSKSGVGNYVPVRPRPSANKKTPLMGVFLYIIKIYNRGRNGTAGSSAS